MHNASPLDTRELREIDDRLNAGELDQAQLLLAEVDVSASEPAVSYLATRLLYLRNRLDPERVVLRLREILTGSPGFNEAASLLRVAEAGVSGPDSLSAAAAVRPSQPAAPDRRKKPPASAPTVSSGGPKGNEPSLRSFDGLSDSDRPTPIASEPPTRARASERLIEVDTRFTADPPPTSMTPPPRPSVSSKPSGRYAFSGSSGLGIARRTPKPPQRVPIGPTPMGTRELRSPNIPRAPGVPNLLGSSRQATEKEARQPLSSRPAPPRISLAPPRRSLAPGAGRYALTSSDRPAQSKDLGRHMPRFRVPRPGSLAPSSRPVPEPEESRQIWPDVEVALFAGQPGMAFAYLEQAAQSACRELGNEVTDFTQLAHAAGALLTRSWVSHHFAPFDLSLHSLARLELFIDALHGSKRLASTSAGNETLNLMLGAYIGETLRISHQGQWHGNSANLDHVCIMAGAYVWRPFETLQRRLLSRGTPALHESIGPGLAHPGTQAWLTCQPSNAPLPKLWDELPGTDHMPVLGAGLCHSVLGLTCRQRSGEVLDRSVASLVSLAQVVDILTRNAAPLSEAETWLQRLSLLVGAYAGEVLRLEVGGAWQCAPESPLLERYYLQLPRGQRVAPASMIARRALAGESSQLQQYVGALLRY